jgi:hypothetical protein
VRNQNRRFIIESIWMQWGAPVVVGIVAIPFAVLLMWWLARHRRRAGVPAPWAARSAFAEVFMVVGTVPWLWLLLSPGPSPGVNLILFHDLMQQLQRGLTYATLQIGGNLLVFAALGFCLPIRFKVGPEVSLLVGTVASAAIEITQYKLNIGRYASIDDVLVNATGAYVAGWLAWPWWRIRLAAAQPAKVRQMSRELVRSSS